MEPSVHCAYSLLLAVFISTKPSKNSCTPRGRRRARQLAEYSDHGPIRSHDLLQDLIHGHVRTEEQVTQDLMISSARDELYPRIHDRIFKIPLVFLQGLVNLLLLPHDEV